MGKLKKIKPIIWAAIGFGALFLLLALKLMVVMLHDSGEIKAMASSQLRNESVLEARRGDITDRNGNLLASSIASFQLDADLISMRRLALGRSDISELSKEDEATVLQYANQWAGQLTQFIDRDREAIFKILTAKSAEGKFLSFGVLGREQSIANLEALQQFRSENNLYWLVISDDTSRFYPNGSMLAQSLGILDGEGTGRFGVEAYYNDLLSGIDGLKISEVDKKSQDILLTEPVITQPVDGKRLVLTIDEKIQSIAEEAARQGLEESNAKAVHVVVANPKNGEILALVTAPSFDLNDPYVSNDSEELLSAWRNRAIADVYEPGSTFKIITMAAALSEGVVDEQDRFNCPGWIEVDGVRIHCAEKKSHGEQDYFDIMANSCNVGFIEIGLKVGRERMEAWAEKFGLGSTLGVDLPGEAGGIMDFQSLNTDYDLANKVIGQATLTSSLQLLNNMNIVANNGFKTTPHILKEVQAPKDQGYETVSAFEETAAEQVLDPEVVETLKEMLFLTVEEGGSRRARIEGLEVMGKTGTAQKINPETGKYEFYVSSFVGSAPVSDPKITVFVAVDEPTEGSTYGSQAAAPLARQIMEASIDYLNSPHN